MSEPSWPEVGKECCCIREVWLKYAGGILGFLTGTVMPRDPAPKFMQTYKIISIEFHEEDDGHQTKLAFAEFPGETWCACGFRPLEKIEEEVRNTAKAPSDLEKV